MLSEGTIIPTIAVKDFDAAKMFYGETLGLESEGEATDESITYRCGTGKLHVYKSGYAGTNQATYAAWEVEDVEKTVAELKIKGVTFEQYDDLPGATREGDIHMMGDEKAAWFKDPDGNILAISTTA